MTDVIVGPNYKMRGKLSNRSFAAISPHMESTRSPSRIRGYGVERSGWLCRSALPVMQYSHEPPAVEFDGASLAARSMRNSRPARSERLAHGLAPGRSRMAPCAFALMLVLGGCGSLHIEPDSTVTPTATV